MFLKSLTVEKFCNIIQNKYTNLTFPYKKKTGRFKKHLQNKYLWSRMTT